MLKCRPGDGAERSDQLESPAGGFTIEQRGNLFHVFLHVQVVEGPRDTSGEVFDNPVQLGWEVHHNIVDSGVSDRDDFFYDELSMGFVHSVKRAHPIASRVQQSSVGAL